jgi:hypothetical protein
MGYISGRAKGKRQEAKVRINNQFLITGFSIIMATSSCVVQSPNLWNYSSVGFLN